MPGIRALRRLQFGKETTAGVAVAATTIWRGVGTIEDQRETVFPEEDIGYLSGVDRSYVPRLAARLSLDEVEATFEQLPYILEMGVKKIDAPTSDGTGSGKIYTYTLPTTQQNIPRTLTIEGGDNQQAEEMEYCFVEAFALSGRAGEAVKVSADVRGRQVQTTTFTGGLSIPSVEEILMSKGELYIDNTSGSIGSTLVSETLKAFDLRVTTGFKAQHTADGQLYFSFVKQTMPEVTLDLTFEHNSSAVAEIANWRSQTARQMRLLFKGSALTTTGTKYANKTFIIDLVGKWEKFDKIDEEDGNDIVRGTFRARYNATAAKYGEFTVVNTLASLP